MMGTEVNSALDNLAAGMAGRGGGESGAGTVKTPVAAAGGAAAGAGKGGGGGDLQALMARLEKLEGVAAENAELKARVGKVEAGDVATRERREAEDAQRAFIMDYCRDVPPEIASKLIPVSKDKTLLTRGAEVINKFVREAIEAGVKAGRLRYVGVGSQSAGGDGGMSPSNVPGSVENPHDNIAAGLRERRG